MYSTCVNNVLCKFVTCPVNTHATYRVICKQNAHAIIFYDKMMCQLLYMYCMGTCRHEVTAINEGRGWQEVVQCKAIIKTVSLPHTVHICTCVIFVHESYMGGVDTCPFVCGQYCTSNQCYPLESTVG